MEPTRKRKFEEGCVGEFISKLRSKNNELNQENLKLTQQMGKLEKDEVNLKEEKNNIKAERDDLKQENDTLSKVMEELKSALECPVCLTLPRAGPVPQCPNGHFICSPCKRKERSAGRQDCPTCRGPMVGEAKSLLATIVIENMKHECDKEDCYEMIELKEYEKHQLEQCNYRSVLCPGRDCDEIVPYMEVVSHAMDCKGGTMVTDMAEKFIEGTTFGVPKEDKDKKMNWHTRKIVNSHVFFFKMTLANNMYKVEVVMVGSSEEADQYNVKIEVLDVNGLKCVATVCCPPRPIDLAEGGDLGLTVSEKVLAKVWHYNEEEKGYEFMVKVSVGKD
jgi:hypothetical protein